MAQTPRTSVHFPRMKVRGRRNKAKLTARHVHVERIPYARPVPIEGGYQFVVITEPEPGAVSINYRAVVDGFGRVVREQAPTPAAPAPEPETSPSRTKFSFSAKVEGDTSALWDLLAGRQPDGEG